MGGGARSHAPRGAVRAWPTPFPYFRFVNVQLFNYSIIQLKNVPRGEGRRRKKIAPIYRKDIEIPLYILFIYMITTIYFIFIKGGRMSFLAV